MSRDAKYLEMYFENPEKTMERVSAKLESPKYLPKNCQ
jgi:hypothetical protein